MNSSKRPTATSTRSSASPSSLPPTPSRTAVDARSSPRKAAPVGAASEPMASPIAARTRGKHHQPAQPTASSSSSTTTTTAATSRLQLPRSFNTSSSLQVPSTASPARPSSALGKRRTAERQDSDDSDDDFEDANDEPNTSKTSELGPNSSLHHKRSTRAAAALGTGGGGGGGGGMSTAAATARRGVGGNRLPGPASASSRIRRLSTASISTTSRLVRPSTSPSKPSSFLHALRSHSPVKPGRAAAAPRPALAQSVGVAGPSSEAAAVRMVKKSGLRPPGSGIVDSLAESSAGSLPRPRKLSRPSTSHTDSSRAAAPVSSSSSSSSSALPKPRLGSTTSFAAGPASKRQSVQFPGAAAAASTSSSSNAPPDSFAKNVSTSAGGAVQFQTAHAPAQSSSSSSSYSSAATVPPSTSTFRFAFPSAARVNSSGAAAHHPNGSTPLRSGASGAPPTVVHPAVASLRPHSLSTVAGGQAASVGGGGGAGGAGAGKLSKVLLPTPDARERGKKRLSGMSLGSNTSMSAILNASMTSSSSTASQRTAVTTAAYDEDKENRKRMEVEGKAGLDTASSTNDTAAAAAAAAIAGATWKDGQVLEQLRTLAQQSGLSLEHLRTLIDGSPEHSSHGLVASGSSSSMDISAAAAANTSRMLLPPAYLHRGQSTPSLRSGSTTRAGAAAGRHKVGAGAGAGSANATAAAAFSPAASDILRLDGSGMSPGVNVLDGEETIDLVNLSLSPPGSIGSPLAADDSILVTLRGGGSQSFGMEALVGGGGGGKAGFGGSSSGHQTGGGPGVAGQEDVHSDAAESDVDMESPLMALAALHSASSDPSLSEARTSSSSEVRLVAGPLPRARQRSDTRQSLGLEHALGPMLEDEEDALGLLMPAASPAPSTAYTDARETIRVNKSSSDSTGTARGAPEAPLANPTSQSQQQQGRQPREREFSYSAEQAAKVATLEAELAQARLEAERLRAFHQVKLAEYEEALEHANRTRDSERGDEHAMDGGKGTPSADNAGDTKEEGDAHGQASSSAAAAAAEEIRKLQGRVEMLRAEQARGRRLYESELAGLEEACAAANQRAIQAEGERAREAAQASERARLDEEARYALSEEAERAMMSLVEEREAAKAEEAQLRDRLESLHQERSRADDARDSQIAETKHALASAQAEVEELVRQVAEMSVDSREAAKREQGLRRELVAQESVVEEAWSSRRVVLGQTAALAWGDLVDYGRNELLLLDGKADMCHFLLAQLDLWDGMLQQCYPAGMQPPSAGEISTAMLKAA